MTGRKSLLFLVLAAAACAQDRADWMKDAKFGVMNHYLAEWIADATGEKMTVERWNRLVDGFDVEGLAKQLASVGAAYYQISLGQNSGYYIAPNAAYDRLTGIQPGKCSRRDLVADLYEALNKRGIKLMVYLPSGAPAQDREAVKALQWTNGPLPNREFQSKWEQVIREWSNRWGKKVVGWWFDGAYWPNAMYRSCDPPNFASFAAAARAGNPASVVAFNPGVTDRSMSITPFEDYTAGEVNDPDNFMIRRTYDGKADGARLQMLCFLGERWGMGTPRFPGETVVNYSRKVWEAGGTVTWDTPVQTNGTMPQIFIDQLAAIGKALGRL